jgi:anti-sigma B factor antagonist
MPEVGVATGEAVHSFMVETSLSVDGAAVLTARGELDLASVDLLTRHVDLVMDGHERIILDLAGLDFIDGTGLSGLIDIDAKLRRRGARLEVVNARRQVAHMLRVTGMDRVFALGEDDTANALS